MVWDYQVPTVVMLTRCVESARVSLTPTIYCSHVVFNSLPHINVNNIAIPAPLHFYCTFMNDQIFAWCIFHVNVKFTLIKKHRPLYPLAVVS